MEQNAAASAAGSPHGRGSVAPGQDRWSGGQFLDQWLILGLVLLALGGVVAYFLHMERQRTGAWEQERLLSQTTVVKHILGQNLASLDIVLAALVTEQAAGRGSHDIGRRLETLAAAMPGVRTLLVVDARGVVLASSRPEILGQEFTGREYFKAPRKNPDRNTLYVSPPFRTVLGVWALNVTRMIPGPGGGFAGVVTATLDPRFFSPLLESVLHTPDAWAGLVHGDGDIFLVAPVREGLQGMNVAKSGTLFTRHMESGGEISMFSDTVFATGELRMVAVRTIHPAGLKMDKPLVVAVSRDLDTIYAAWRSEARFVAALSAVVCLVSAAGLALFQRRQREHDRLAARAARALQDNERFLRALASNLPGMVGYWSRDLRCGFANHAYREWFGRTPEQMLGIRIQDLMGEELFRKNEPYMRAALRGEPQQFERTLVKADGSTGYTRAHYIPDSDGEEVRGFFVLVSDITELKLTQFQLEKQVKELDLLATTDSLTGCRNRRSFMQRVEEECVRSRRYGHPLSFLMLDIDHFKAINDAHGHDAGDEVLKALVSLCRGALRTSDEVGRLGGEEFGALLVNTDLSAAEATAERLRGAFEAAEVATVSGPVRFTASIGLTGFLGGDDLGENLYKRADTALYRAKEAGRNRVRVLVGPGEEPHGVE
ncbi:MAG: diguanylate cyclase [Thermodesulfobacteriota bacterium]